jgi:hypothetical protein
MRQDLFPVLLLALLVGTLIRMFVARRSKKIDRDRYPFGYTFE